MLISLRGTSGSGKSTVVFTLMKNYFTEKIMGEDGKLEGYRIHVPSLEKPVYAVGRYETPCGGCDSVPTQAEIVRRVEKYRQAGGHVIFEGLLASGGYGTVGALSEKYPDEYIFATLDTPYDVCVARVLSRRAAAGNDKPFNEKNTKSKFDSTRNVMRRVLAEGRKAVWIDHTRAVEQVLELME